MSYLFSSSSPLPHVSPPSPPHPRVKRLSQQVKHSRQTPGTDTPEKRAASLGVGVACFFFFFFFFHKVFFLQGYFFKVCLFSFFFFQGMFIFLFFQGMFVFFFFSRCVCFLFFQCVFVFFFFQGVLFVFMCVFFCDSFMCMLRFLADINRMDLRRDGTENRR